MTCPKKLRVDDVRVSGDPEKSSTRGNSVGARENGGGAGSEDSSTFSRPLQEFLTTMQIDDGEKKSKVRWRSYDNEIFWRVANS